MALHQLRLAVPISAQKGAAQDFSDA